MRIAQVAPLAESVPPRLYGGTERIASWLTEELVRQGHQVTLFASGDSQTAAELVACAPRGLRLAGIRDHTASHLARVLRVILGVPDGPLNAKFSGSKEHPYEPAPTAAMFTIPGSGTLK